MHGGHGLPKFLTLMLMQLAHDYKGPCYFQKHNMHAKDEMGHAGLSLSNLQAELHCPNRACECQH